MQKSESLKKTDQFSQVYKKGRSRADKRLVMYVLDNDTGCNRLGISVSKKVGNSVVRHHLCRLVREAYRLHENVFNSGLDIVVVARKGTDKCSYFDIEESLMHLAKLHHITGKKT
ncbi:MAG: ribonuclease P protein component [Lachnospiraceae bacterium]|nr:ribonuclease P protein component [Lachnospiraceae bacterium]